MTSAAVIAPMSAIAQTPTCTATPDCASLGYTQSSCPDNNGVRCPWGDKWFCTKTCSEMGFNYTCSGTGYSGGAGEACEGKYTSCTCSSPYAWNGSACACPSTYKYTCSGTGYAGGAGTACGGKYTECTCAANIRHALVQAGINGRAGNVKRRRYGVLARVLRHSVRLGISCSATELAARIRCLAKRQSLWWFINPVTADRH